MSCYRLHTALLVTALLTSTGLSAAALRLDPSVTSGLAPGERFSLSIHGSDFRDGGGLPGTLGGGVDIQWDPAVLTIASLDDIELKLFTGNALNIVEKGTLDQAAGSLRNLTAVGLGTGPVDAADFDVAVIVFTAVAVGSSAVSLSEGTFDAGGANVWADQLGLMFDPDVEFGSASVTVANAVPVPGTLVLLPGALLMIRRRVRRPI